MNKLLNVRDLLMPGIWAVSGQHPDIEINIGIDNYTDSLIIRSYNKTTKASYTGVLFTRSEIEDNVYKALFGERLLFAVMAVKPTLMPCDPGAQEYEEIMEGQAIMDKIQP